jgi:peptidoglycan L-alanyl-D-glutamate endopeptidase CwlK
LSGHHYGPESLAKLERAHPDLRKVMLRVGPRFPSTILEAARSVEQQRRNVEKGVSKTMDSKHILGERRDLSDAVDAAPDPLRWPQVKKLMARIEEVAGKLGSESKTELLALVGEAVKEHGRWYYHGGYVSGVADEMYERGEISVPLRWGGDWNGNRQVDDQSFDDLPHHERRT